MPFPIVIMLIAVAVFVGIGCLTERSDGPKVFGAFSLAAAVVCTAWLTIATVQEETVLKSYESSVIEIQDGTSVKQLGNFGGVIVDLTKESGTIYAKDVKVRQNEMQTCYLGVDFSPGQKFTYEVVK